MKLSIITVTYNCKEDFLKTYRSLAMQSSTSFEYIVIDGGSTDGTLEEVRRGKLVTKWISEKDNGIYDAMNKAINMATGDFLIFLNAGDYLMTDFLSKIDLYKAPGIIPVVYKKANLWNTVLKKKSYKTGIPYCHQGIIFERKKIYYDLSYKIAADYDFYLQFKYRDLPFLIKYPEGSIYYDNAGYSMKNAYNRDKEIESIILKNFGPVYSNYFKLKCILKRNVRRFFKRISN